jgi:hypothetical protein
MNSVFLSGSAAAILLLASLVQAGGPFAYGGYGGCSTCGPGCWAGPGCCDRPVSKHDHIWDNYCQEKWCPTCDSAYLRPYWHGAPISAGYGYGASGYGSYGYGSYGGSHYAEGIPAHDPVSYSRPALQSPSPTPALPSSDNPPEPPKPEMKLPMPPNSPPAPEADKPLELKLLPLSRQRAPQP